VFGDCDCLVSFIFTMIESSVDGFNKEGDFEDFEENQGQANQGMPSILIIYLDTSCTYASF
jgi:hypothetical protein